MIVESLETSSLTPGILKHPSLKTQESPCSSIILALINVRLKVLRYSLSSLVRSSFSENGSVSTRKRRIGSPT